MRFRYGEAAVAGYGNRIWANSTAKWGVQIAGMIFRHALGVRIKEIIRNENNSSC